MEYDRQIVLPEIKKMPELRRSVSSELPVAQNAGPSRKIDEKYLEFSLTFQPTLLEESRWKPTTFLHKHPEKSGEQKAYRNKVEDK